MGTIQVSPGQLVVRFPYSSERVAAIRAVPGRRWHAEEKIWTIPHTPEFLARVRSLFTSDRVVVAAAVEATSTELPTARVTPASRNRQAQVIQRVESAKSPGSRHKRQTPALALESWLTRQE